MNFDIDDLTVSKIVGDTVDFTSDVDSVDKGIEVIKNDIHSILGIEENNILNLNMKNSFQLLLKVVILRISL
jgi:hypothetical protein